VSISESLPSALRKRTTPGWAKKIVISGLALLRQGTTPEKLALSVALGIALGITPALGFASALCLAAAIPLGLNAVAIQLVNYLVYPLQIVLLIAFIRIGEWLFAAQPLKLSAARILDLIRHCNWSVMQTLWGTALHSVVAWLLVGSLAALGTYALLVPLLRKLATPLKRDGRTVPKLREVRPPRFAGGT
jgi:uncharacterized protein (DUF2062 family)